MKVKNTLKLAKQFIKAQGGFTVAEIDQHYQPLMSQCQTPDELGILLEEWRRVKAGWVAPWMDPTLPKIGEIFEFDYTDREETTKNIRLVVVDVTAEHVIYKMPSESVNKIWPMTHEYWRLNEDQRRPVVEPSTAP